MMNFPAIELWRTGVVLAGDKRFCKEHLYNYYFGKFLIANAFGPKAIAEIGVRWGYSAFSFLCASPAASYTGFDMIGGGHGGAKENTFARVNLMLKEHFPDAKVTLEHCDTRRAAELGGPYDFVHVDGNHTQDACRHDIELAMAALGPGGVILIDDYTAIEGVKKAADGYVKDNQGLIERRHIVPSLTGELIIIKKGGKS